MLRRAALGERLASRGQASAINFSERAEQGSLLPSKR